MIWHSHLFQSFPEFLVVHAVKGFGIVNKAEGDVFLELFSFFYDPKDVGNLISGSSAFSKSSLNIRSQVNSDPEDKQNYSQPVLQVLNLVADLKCILKQFRVKNSVRHTVLWTSWLRKRFSDRRFLHLPHTEKHENNELVTSDLCVSQ